MGRARETREGRGSERFSRGSRAGARTLFLCLSPSLRSRRLEVMGTVKNEARERDTRGERE